MGIQTDLSGAPYFDDYDPNKNYYRILFRPGVAIQARELNQLQTILQNQIERFGDNIYKQGTIIDGCAITYHSYFPFIKIRDVESDGTTSVSVSNYQGYRIRHESSNLQAVIVSTLSGYESRDDKNTLYLRYQNGGTAGNLTSFSANDVLTIYDIDNPISRIKVNNGSTGFSNSDTVIVTPVIAVQNTTGGTTFANTFAVNDEIYVTGRANAVITSVNTTISSDYILLGIRPYYEDLANTSLTSVKWEFGLDDQFSKVGAGTGANVAVVTQVFGSGANAEISTSSAGVITGVTIVSGGSEYDYTPQVTVQSSTASAAEIDLLDLEAQTYVGRVTVLPSESTPTGSGYALTVDEGIVYQKGHFTKVLPQTVVVERYTSAPNEKVVGFATAEEIINSNQDQSLLDNSIGTPNETAPGANRLKLTPQLVVLTKDEAEANTDFLPIIEFTEGFPSKQFTQTQFNSVNEELARRTYEESGNYVLDQFLTTTKSRLTFTEEKDYFNVVVDPGLAYIQGKRVQTYYNYNARADKGTDTSTTSPHLAIDYGNYIRIKEVGGSFDSVSGAVVSLRDSAGQFITSAGGSITAPGNEIGTARVRAVRFERGIPGTPEALYKMYLFEIKMNTGKNFEQVRSVYQDNSTYKGLADVYTETIVIETPIQVIANTGNTSILTLVSGNTAAPNPAVADPIKSHTGGKNKDKEKGRKAKPLKIKDKLSRSSNTGSVNAGPDLEITRIINATSFAISNASAIVANGMVTLSTVNTYITSAVLYAGGESAIVFPVGVNAAKTVGDINYVAREEQTVTISAGGNTSATINSTALATIDDKKIQLVPLTALTSNVVATGNTTLSSTSNGITGTATSFLNLFYAGDFIKVANATANAIVQINKVVNSTYMEASANASAAVTSGNVYLYFPANVPIDLNRQGRSITATSNTVLSIDIGNTATATADARLSYDVIKTSGVSLAANRNVFVRLKLANNAAVNSAEVITSDYGRGPWCLGVPDIFRLRNVYVANGSPNVNTTFNSASGVTSTGNLILVTSNPYANGDVVTYNVPNVDTVTALNVTANTANATLFVLTSGNTANLAVGDVIANSSNVSAVNTNIVASVNNVINSTAFYTNVAITVANGTATIYSTNTVAASAVTGLAVGNTYYIANTFANSSAVGFQLANSTGGIIAISPKVGVSETHRFTGSPLYFGPLTTGVRNVTSDFYVDTNQTEDYYNVAYLYRRQRTSSSGTYSNNDVFLVEVDAFSVGNEGLKTISSYNVNDAVSFANATNTSINTAEIPEFFNNYKGSNIDLRDAFDFRPFVANTANLTSAFANATINPVEPASNSKFTSSNKYFPVPGSTLTANVVYYLPRVDRLVVDSDNRIRVIKGTVDANKKPVTPPEPPSSITLNVLVIPPYPSYPFALSSDQINYLDTKLGNEKLLYTRYKKYQVSQQLTVDARQQLQPRAYKMTDIGQLERRIRDLEYYVSMNLAESSVNSKFIGSSADSTLNRYKFGFYVDTFVDANLSDVDNPQYSCTIVDNRLAPKMEQIVIPGRPVNPEPPAPPVTPIEPEECTEQPTDTANGTITQVISQYVDYATESYGTANTDGTRLEIHTKLEFSNTSGPAKLYIDVPDAGYVVEVYQSPDKNTKKENLGVATANSTQVITSASAVTLTDQEKIDKSIPLVKYQTFVAPYTVGTYNNTIRGAAKLSWTHTPTNGRFYTIVVRRLADVAIDLNALDKKNKQKNYYNKGKLILNYPADSNGSKLESTIKVDKISYRGHCTQKDDIKIEKPHKDERNTRAQPGMPWVQRDQKISMTLSGLKPNTKHSFLIDGEDRTSSVAQVGKSILDDLVSDDKGNLQIEYFHGAVKSLATSEFAASARNAADTGSSIKTVVITSEDNTSSVRTTLTTPEYTTDYVNTTAESPAILQPTVEPSVVIPADASNSDRSGGSVGGGTGAGGQESFNGGGRGIAGWQQKSF